jgi:capsular exopolysaccharide synthesis family protein
MSRRHREEDEGLRVAVSDGRSAASEAYRTLRTNIQFMTLDNLTKSILVVGAHPSCGKTTTVTNLGLTLAQAGSSVLLVDTDLRRPKLHNVFNCKNFFGLTTMLIEEDLNMNAARHKTLIPNLEVIPSGPVPPNPAELLASRKMVKALKEFQHRYDYVILDSPPMLNMADASILAQMADATVLVVAYAETTKEEAQKVHQQLQMAKANLIGVVINGVPPHLDPYGYYGYYMEEPVEKKPKKEKKRKDKKKKHLEEDDGEFDLGFDQDDAYRDF